MEFANLLHSTRAPKGAPKRASRADVAAALGVSRFTVRLWEIGECAPPKSRLRDIARVYGLDLDELTRAWLDAEPVPARERATEAA